MISFDNLFRPCTKDTVMRIASISKPLTAAIAGKLLEMGKIELDSSIYVSCYIATEFVDLELRS